jgi:predicted Zn-dependent protease
MVVPRSEVGFTTNPTGTIDILMAADSAFSYVEQNAPQCADSIALFRQQPWVKLVNEAGAAVNAEKYDSAAYLANRSLIIYRNSPYAYNILAVIAQRKNDFPTALENYKQVVAKTVGDTAATSRRMRKEALYNTALLTQNIAAQKSDAAMARQVPDLWRAYLKEYPDDADAKGALARAVAATGDTAAVAAIYADMMTNPAKYTDQQLVEAGVGMANNNKSGDAIKLFSAALAQNPYNRDALFDLATTHFSAGNAVETRTYAHRLVALDPSNPDNYKLIAGSYQLQAGETKDAKAKKTATDSLLAYLQKAGQMTARVTFDQFNHNGAKHDLVGKVENLGTAAASYNLKVEFLDKSGNAIATQAATVASVGPKESKPFTVTANKEGIVAFRYTLTQ